jgi:6-phosphogluconolactonase
MCNEMKTDVLQFESHDAFSLKAAGVIATEITGSVDRNGFCSLVLSGGLTPAPVYRQLAQLNVPWNAVHVFWGDERHVPPYSPDSNYHMAEEHLLSWIVIPRENIHRIHSEFMSAEDAAADYELDIRNFAAEQAHEDNHSTLVPSFDIVLLGIGPDGHTASLFPHDTPLNEVERLVTASGIPEQEPHVQRITMTFPLLNTARTVVFLAAGKEKQDIIDTILSRPDAAMIYPAARITPREKRIFITTDR